jgi:hypothetical protein
MRSELSFPAILTLHVFPLTQSYYLLSSVKGGKQRLTRPTRSGETPLFKLISGFFLCVPS